MIPENVTIEDTKKN